jgi:DNA-binding NtrC family response regulator
MSFSILIVDDQEAFAQQIRVRLEREGYEAEVGSRRDDILMLLQERRFNLVISDMKMPQMDGLELLGEVKGKYPDTAFIIMTAFGSVETAVDAMKRGANDYITKPFPPEELLLTIKNVLEKQSLLHEIKVLRKEVERRYSFGNFIGKSPRMQEVYDLISDVAETDATVLIRGETGTGKELVAKSIHFNSSRKDRIFVGINCGALTETLLESELFGYEKGAFTGAMKQKLGKFEQADGGTLFLDEIGEFSPNTQVKLLRVLQERVIERVGGNREIKVDVRIIAATNRDLEEEVAKGGFREDLYYRINVVPIWLPPLRERREDIPLLAKYFLAKYTHMFKRDTTLISQDVLNEMMTCDWPGNVRQLENVIERAIIMAKGSSITHIDLLDKPKRTEEKPVEVRPRYIPDLENLPFKEAKRRLIKEYEREYITGLLKRCKGSITLSSNISHLDMKTLRRKMEEYGLYKEHFKSKDRE